MSLTIVSYDPVLASPLFRERHDRQLLEMLVKHDRSSIDGYAESVKSEYVFLKVSLNAVS